MLMGKELAALTICFGFQQHARYTTKIIPLEKCDRTAKINKHDPRKESRRNRCLQQISQM